MKKFEVALCETNNSLLLNATAYFQDDNDIRLVICGNAKELADAVLQNGIDCVLLDVAFERSREFAIEFTQKDIKVILLSKAIGEEAERVISNIPHDACFYKPYSLLEVRTYIMRLMVQRSLSVKLNMGIKNIDERLSSIFIRAGIPPHIKGYQFLREAVKLAVMYPEMINAITKKLYPSVAELFNTTPSKVERAIRHAIEVAWNRGKIENINAIFGIKIYNKGEKPTNGELIALVADKIMIESM